jgi:hypothetical protein
MRPWEVLVAQILQFQTQLAEVLAGTGPESSDAARAHPAGVTPDELAETLDRMAADLRAGQESTGAAEALLGLAGEILPGERSLPELGIHELPPVGFLPVPGFGRDSEAAVSRLLSGLELRFRPCRADEVAHAIEAVQHGDRIRFADRDPVDVLVPAPEGQEPRPWVAFVRRRTEEARLDTSDVVEVVLAGADDGQDRDAGVKAVRTQGPAGVPAEWTTRTTVASYPRDAWALPEPDDAWTMVHGESLGDETVVVACVSAEARRPLGLARAILLVGEGASMTGIPFVTVLPDVPEAIVVLVPQALTPVIT